MQVLTMMLRSDGLEECFFFLLVFLEISSCMCICLDGHIVIVIALKLNRDKRERERVFSILKIDKYVIDKWIKSEFTHFNHNN